MKKLRIVTVLCLGILLAAAGFRIGVTFPRAVQVVELPSPTPADGATLDALLRQIARQHRFGDRDDWREQSMLFDMARNGQVFELTCSYISYYAKRVLDAYGFRTRIGLMFATEYTPDNLSHTILEVYHPFYAQWVVVDFSFDRMYAQTLLEFVRRRDTAILLSEDAWATDPEADPTIYPHVARIPLLYDETGLYYADAAHREIVERISPEAQHDPRFLERFYPS